MGLLDDAIREHLDLKRRRGGDPAEIERLEREALGPVRREPTPGAPPPSSYEERGAGSSVMEAAPDRAVDPYDEHELGDTDFESESALPDDRDTPREPHPDFHGAVGAPPPVEEHHQKRRFLRRPSSLSGPPRDEPHHDEPRQDVPDRPDTPRGETPASEPAAPAGAAPTSARREPDPPHLTLEGEIHHAPGDEDDRPASDGPAAPDRPAAPNGPPTSDLPPEEQATHVHRVVSERRTGETVEFDVRKEFHAEDAGGADAGPSTREPAPREPEQTRAPEPDPRRAEPESAEGGQNSAQGDKDDEGDGDVLEETPEFLQDAPEHERLWFEQRPPRDFDFDG